MISLTDEEGEQTYTYDRRGNLTAVSRGEELLKVFAFDAANRMSSAIQIKEGMEKRAEYRYNAFGNRTGQDIYSRQLGSGIPDISRKEPENPEQQIRYTLDLTRQYYNLLMSEDSAGQKGQTFYWDGNVAAMEEAGQDSYYLQDDLGSPMQLLDENGGIRESYGYDEFGRSLYEYPEEQLQPFGYTGYQAEAAGGLYFAQARQYDAAAGRFVSEDKIPGFMALPYTMNRYSYCWNRPMEHVDLNGKKPWIAKQLTKVIATLTDYVSEQIAILRDAISRIEIDNANYIAAVYLINESGALGQGHAALLLLKDDGQAEFYSYAGRVNLGAVTIGSEGYLSTHIGDDGNPATIAIEDFVKTKGAYADRVDSKGTNIGNIDSYTNGVYIPITNKEGIAMHDEAMEIRSEPGKYNLWNHNCGQVAQIILQAGDKNFADTSFAWWNTRPNSVYNNIKKEIDNDKRQGWKYGTIEELMLLESIDNDNCIGE